MLDQLHRNFQPKTYDTENSLPRQLVEEDLKKKTKYKVLHFNTVDPHTQNPNIVPAGRNVNKNSMKKPLDNFKHNNGGNTTGYRTLMRMTGTSDEIVNSQRRKKILTNNDMFEGKQFRQKQQKYGFVKIN